MKEILITSSILIVVIMLLRWLLRGKVSQRLIYAAWLLVALRLLIPVQFGQSNFSVTSLTQQLESQSKSVQQLQQAMDEPVVGPSRTELYQQLLDDYIKQHSAEGQPSLVTPEIRQQLNEQVDDTITIPSLSDILIAVWIIGMCGMGAWFVAANAIFLRRARKDSSPIPCDEATVPVRISDNVPTPCLVGFFRPVIYLTPGSTADEQTQSHVLAHELTHLRHLDHIWALVRCLCLCIYWFNPLVWLAAGLSRRDCELACDEGALKRLGDEQRIAYGKTLLTIVTQSISPVHLLETPTAMNENKKQLKERVHFIAKKRKNWLIAAICLVLIAAITTGCAFLGSKPNTGTPGASVITHGASGREGYRYVYLVKEVTVYFSDGSPNTRTTYTYDEKGRVAVRDHVNYFSDSFSQKTTYYREYNDLVTRIHHEDPMEQYDTTFSYEFNDNGTIASMRCTSFGTSITNYAFEYDSLGRLSVTTLTFSSHKGEQHCYCFYDADGRLYKFTSPYSSTSQVDNTLTYDDQGRLTSLRCASLQVINRDYTYDENGNLTAKQAVNWTDPSLIYTYTDGVLTSIEYVIDPRCSTLKPKTYTLDEFGNVIRIATEDGKCTEYTYERMELPEEDARRVLLRHPINDGEDVSIEAYRDNFLEYYVS